MAGASVGAQELRIVPYEKDESAGYCDRGNHGQGEDDHCADLFSNEHAAVLLALVPGQNDNTRVLRSIARAFAYS